MAERSILASWTTAAAAAAVPPDDAGFASSGKNDSVGSEIGRAHV